MIAIKFVNNKLWTTSPIKIIFYQYTIPVHTKITFVDLTTSSDFHLTFINHETHTRPNSKRGRLCMWEIVKGWKGSSVVGVVYNLSPCQTQTIVFTHRKSQLLSVYFTNLHPFYRNKVSSKEIYRYCFISSSTNEKKLSLFFFCKSKKFSLVVIEQPNQS